MDPVQKAVINHTFGVPQPLKKKQIISCNICHLRFNSTVRNGAFLKCGGQLFVHALLRRYRLSITFNVKAGKGVFFATQSRSQLPGCKYIHLQSKFGVEVI